MRRATPTRSTHETAGRTGLRDLHTHLREPVARPPNRSRAAPGRRPRGYCALVAMPNTEPASTTSRWFVRARARCSHAPRYRGGRRSPRSVEVSYRAHGRDGRARSSTLHGRWCRRAGSVGDATALTYAKPLGVRLAQHCEDEQLAAGGTMNEGALSGRLGLIGRPALAEELMVMRDIELVRMTMHPCIFSISRRVAPCSWYSVRARRTAGHLRSGAAPLHARRRCLRELRPGVQGSSAVAHASDVAALRDALRRGVVDAVATDTPRTPRIEGPGLLMRPRPGCLGSSTPRR